MTLRQVHKFEFTCDGYRPDGRVCGVTLKTEQYGTHEAEIYARDLGWTQGHRGWICGSSGGHRGDMNRAELIASLVCVDCGHHSLTDRNHHKICKCETCDIPRRG